LQFIDNSFAQLRRVVAWQINYINTISTVNETSYS